MGIEKLLKEVFHRPSARMSRLRCFVTRSPARLLKPQEVADLLAVKKSTVVKWARRGKMPAIKTPGGRHRFRSSDVEALVGNTDTTETAAGEAASQ